MQIDKKIRIAKLLCLLPGVFLIVSGIMLLFFPIPAMVLFDLPDASALKNPITSSLGIRQLAIGLTITALSISNETKALAYVMLIGSIVPLVDFMVFIPSIGVISSLRHFGPVPLIIGLGLYLLIRSDRNAIN